MTRDEALRILKRHEGELRQRGVARAAVFGSVARDEARPGSDIDVMIEFRPDAVVSVWAYAGLKDLIQGYYAEPVDVVTRNGLNRHIRPAVEREALYAF
ncbi:nucleotidyltransferase family protein [uncultured Caulobacter sp.]|uniref:nucleotidyltransferase family protein n=1 Tax=uncultured Caulobacter sp. TaxID=158749 RepID=UPI00260FD6D9|nr:nucleotidyltransferase family protein [uncultured Caulobacter sp.]